MKRILLASLFTFTISQPSDAAPAEFVMHKDSAGNVYVSGHPNSDLSVKVFVDGPNQLKTLRTNACGVVVFKFTTAFALMGQIEGTPFNMAQMEELTVPKCNSTTGQLAEPRPAIFLLPDSVGIVFTGLQPNRSVSVSFTGSVTRKVKINACGWGKLANKSATPFASQTRFAVLNGIDNVGSVPKHFSNLPIQPKWLCKKQPDGSYKVYKPQI